MDSFYEKTLDWMKDKENIQNDSLRNEISLTVKDFLDQKSWTESSEAIKKVITWMASQLPLEKYRLFRDSLSQRARNNDKADDKLQLYDLVASLYNNVEITELNEEKTDNNDSPFPVNTWSSRYQRRHNHFENNEFARNRIRVTTSEVAKIKINFKNHDFDIDWSQVLVLEENSNEYILRLYLHYDWSNFLLKNNERYKNFSIDVPFTYYWSNTIRIDGKSLSLWSWRKIKVWEIEFSLRFDWWQRGWNRNNDRQDR